MCNNCAAAWSWSLRLPWFAALNRQLARCPRIVAGLSVGVRPFVLSEAVTRLPDFFASSVNLSVRVAAKQGLPEA